MIRHSFQSTGSHVEWLEALQGPDGVPLRNADGHLRSVKLSAITTRRDGVWIWNATISRHSVKHAAASGHAHDQKDAEARALAWLELELTAMGNVFYAIQQRDASTAIDPDEPEETSDDRAAAPLKTYLHLGPDSPADLVALR